MAGNKQTSGVPMAAKLTEGASNKPFSAADQLQAPLRPLADNSQHATDPSAAAPALVKAPSRKRGRPAKQQTQATASLATADPATDDVSLAELAQAARNDSAEGANGAQAASETLPDANGASTSQAQQQIGNGAKPKPQRKPRQPKTAAVAKQSEVSQPAEQLPQAAAVKQEASMPADAAAIKVESADQQPASVSEASGLPGAMDNLGAVVTDLPKQPAAKPKRKPRQSKAASKAVAPAVKEEQQAASDHLASASDADMMSDISATASAATAQPEAASKPKPKRKPRQTKAQKEAAAAAAAATAFQDRAAAGNTAEPVKLDRRKRAKIEHIVADVKEEVAHDAAEQDPAVAQAPIGGLNEHKPQVATDAAVADASVSASEASQEATEGGKAPAKRKRAPKKQAAPPSDAEGAASMSDASVGTEGAGAKAKAPRKRAPKKAPAPDGPDGQPSTSETSCEQVQVEGSDSVKKVRKSRKKFNNELTIRLVAAAKAALAAPETVVVPPRPVPNLGYACLNSTLQAQKPPVTSNRGAILRTFEEKGLTYISQLALQNAKDLLPIVQWNHEHNIRLFRLSSDLFPWGDSGKYKLEELPDLPEIETVLAEVGALARLYKQRLTAHPSEFVKMAAQKDDIIYKSILDLENHSRVFDMMGYEPNYWNKINIHIGGTYGKEDEHKAATLERFVENFQKLSPNVKKRLAVENDDKPTQWSITDLLPLHERLGIAITFDFHHHRFCQGGKTEEEAFKAAIATWPKDVRPQVHWSEEPEDPTKVRRAHSRFIRGPMNLHGHAADVDIMVEAKAKELTVLDFRKTDDIQVDLALIPGTLESPEAVRNEYEKDIEGACKARVAVEEQEVLNKAKREEEAKKAAEAGALKFLPT